MLYTPFLPEAAAGTLEPRHVVTPLRDIIHRANLRLGAVDAHDPEATHGRHPQSLRETSETVAYDQLVLAPGSISRFLPVPGLSEHAVGFKSLADAIYLRNHVIESLELANATEDETLRDQLLTYVFVGGGYAGLEALAELQDFAADAMSDYPQGEASRHALDPGRGGRPGHARDRRRSGRLRAARTARSRDRRPC